MISPQRKRELKEFQEKLNLVFQNENILNQSLTHSSYANEISPQALDNERLEFLGDAVLKLVISEYLYHKYPDRPEGDLTKIRSTVVSDATLYSCAQKLNAGDFLLLGKNEKSSGGARRRSNLANALEAIIAAVYLDQGISPARYFIENLLTKEVEKVSREGFIIDYKSTLQELAQKNKWGLPRYKVVKELGPKHRKVFWVQVTVNRKTYGRGRGYTKKAAEQAAATLALKKINLSDKDKVRVGFGNVWGNIFKKGRNDAGGDSN